MSTESRPASAARGRSSGARRLTPGVTLGRQRYRLLEEVGADARCAAKLWRGRDLVLERDVALTLFVAEPGEDRAVAAMSAALQRALRSARLESAGAARVLDVIEPEQGPGPTIAAVVAEWTPGRDLMAVLGDGLPPPAMAAHMLAALAGAVDDAHRAGLVLGCDHPQRIRIGPDGHAKLAFPGPPPDTGPRDDVRGLGAALYLLLTGRWALRGGPKELPVAPRERDGTLASPRALRSAVPLELSTLALRSLAGSGTNGVHTGAAVQRLLQRGAAGSNGETLSESSERSAGSSHRRTSVWHEADDTGSENGEGRRRKLRVGVTALVMASLLILGWLSFQVASIFLVGGQDPAVVIDGAPEDSSRTRGQAQPAKPATRVVNPVEFAVYDPSGKGADNVEDVGLVADGNAETVWSTDSYFEQFPAYKQGLGVMLSFDQPTVPRAITIESPSPGTEVQVRAAPAPDTPLSATTVLATATLQPDSTRITLQQAPRTAHLLVWITKLKPAGEDFQSAFGEINVQARPGNSIR